MACLGKELGRTKGGKAGGWHPLPPIQASALDVTLDSVSPRLPHPQIFLHPLSSSPLLSVGAETDEFCRKVDPKGGHRSPPYTPLGLNVLFLKNR